MRDAENAACLRSRDARKTGIEEHDVGSGFGNEVGDVFCRISLADNLEVGIIAQHRPNPLAHNLVVVDDRDADHRVVFGTGTEILTMTPQSSPFSIVSVPPRPSILRRMSKSPKWL